MSSSITSHISNSSRSASRSDTRRFDWAGPIGRWLLFCSGLALLVSTIILPAQIDLINTRTQRDIALHHEQSQHTRIDRYQAFLSELNAPSDSTVELLALSQLGIITESHDALIIPGRPADPKIFEYLEPTIEPFVSSPRRVSRLEELTTEHQSRLWVLIIGAVAVLYGLLPAAKS